MDNQPNRAMNNHVSTDELTLEEAKSVWNADDQPKREEMTLEQEIDALAESGLPKLAAAIRVMLKYVS